MKTLATSAIASKSQTVIPRQVRESPGDRLRYVETAEGIVIEKARIMEHDPFATFTVWASDADERTYADL